MLIICIAPFDSSLIRGRTNRHELDYDVNMTQAESYLHDLESSGPFGLTRPLRAAAILVPSRIELLGDKLYWSFDAERGKNGLRFRAVRPGLGLLQDFVNLAHAPSEKILQYAKKWGVLEICEHQRPACHQRLNGLLCEPQLYGDLFWEDVSVWRQYARLFRSHLSIAARLASGEKGLFEDWEVVIKAQGFSEGKLFQQHGLAVDHEKLKVALNVLLSESAVGPLVLWSAGRWQIHFSATPAIGCALFGAIVCQLMLAATRTEGLAICSGCGTGYLPMKRPNQARRNYCDTCRNNKLPARDAARDYRRRRSGP